MLITQIPEVAMNWPAMLSSAGHKPVAVLCARQVRQFGVLAEAVPETLDLLSPGRRDRIAPLLTVSNPDLVICYDFTWRIPPEALAVSRLGAINIHPSRLPKYRGPLPVAHTLLNGDPELGMTIHRMDSNFDTGAILAQAAAPICDSETFESIIDKLRSLTAHLLPVALERLARGDEGDPQPVDGASYAGFLMPGQEMIKWDRPAREVHNQVLALHFTPEGSPAVGEVNGKRLRIKATRLEPVEGAIRVECSDGPIWLVKSETIDD